MMYQIHVKQLDKTYEADDSSLFDVLDEVLDEIREISPDERISFNVGNYEDITSRIIKNIKQRYSGRFEHVIDTMIIKSTKGKRLFIPVRFVIRYDVTKVDDDTCVIEIEYKYSKSEYLTISFDMTLKLKSSTETVGKIETPTFTSPESALEFYLSLISAIELYNEKVDSRDKIVVTMGTIEVNGMKQKFDMGDEDSVVEYLSSISLRK